MVGVRHRSALPGIALIFFMGCRCVLRCERGSDGAETATWRLGWRRKDGSYFLSELLLLSGEACFVASSSFFFFSDNAVRKLDQSGKQQTNKNTHAKFQNTRQKFTLMLLFFRCQTARTAGLCGTAVTLKWNTETEIGVVSWGSVRD